MRFLKDYSKDDDHVEAAAHKDNHTGEWATNNIAAEIHLPASQKFKIPGHACDRDETRRPFVLC